jgi:hypothetical protein
MDFLWLDGVMETAPLVWLSVVVLMIMMAAAGFGALVRRWHEARERTGKESKADIGEDAREAQEGYLVSAVLGLLALLMGFTFALAVDRFETRRSLTLEEANALQTVYLRSQLLQQPHRDRMDKLLIEYGDNRLALGRSGSREVEAVVERNNQLVIDIWTAAVAAFPTIQGMDFSSAYLDSVKELINLDMSRKAALLVRVPTAVYGVLLIYMVVTAWVMGYVLVGTRGQVSAVFMLVLLVISLTLVVDIDRPGVGYVEQPQWSIEAAVKMMKSEPPQIFDRWKGSATP